MGKTDSHTNFEYNQAHCSGWYRCHDNKPTSSTPSSSSYLRLPHTTSRSRRKPCFPTWASTIWSHPTRTGTCLPTHPRLDSHYSLRTALGAPPQRAAHRSSCRRSWSSHLPLWRYTASKFRCLRGRYSVGGLVRACASLTNLWFAWLNTCQFRCKGGCWCIAYC